MRAGMNGIMTGDRRRTRVKAREKDTLILETESMRGGADEWNPEIESCGMRVGGSPLRSRESRVGGFS